MTKVISSQTSNKKYFLTIENGKAVECNCKGHHYTGHCKHVNQFNQEVTRAAAFLALKARIATAEREARVAHRIAFELMMNY